MGYQLWTSPITGYRRRGTKLIDFNEAFGHKITAGAILEPIKSCPAQAPADEMKFVLEQLDFDIAGVRESEDKPVEGFVRQKDLKNGLVKNHTVDIPENILVDDSTTVYALLNMLRKNPFILIRSEGVTNGIVTRADLNKPVVRVYFFGLISLLEIHLSFWIGQGYPGESWKKEVGEARVAAAERMQAERLERGQTLPLTECLQFCDKHKLVRNHDRLRTELHLGTKNGTTRYLRNAENLRNSLAHSQYDLTIGQSWTELIDLIHMIESTISLSDQLVETRAGGMATNDIGALW